VSQEEHGALYYRLSEKAKQKGRPHQAFFRVHLHYEYGRDKEKAAGVNFTGLCQVLRS